MFKKTLVIAALATMPFTAGASILATPLGGQFRLELNRMVEAPGDTSGTMLLQGTGEQLGAGGFQGSTASLIAVAPEGVVMTPALLGATFEYQFVGCTYAHPRIQVIWNTGPGTTLQEQRGGIVTAPVTSWTKFDYRTAVLDSPDAPPPVPAYAPSIQRINLIVEGNFSLNQACTMRIRELHVYRGAAELELASAYPSSTESDIGGGVEPPADSVTATMDFGAPFSLSPAGTPMLQLTEGADLKATVTVYAPDALGTYALVANRNVNLVLEVDCGGQQIPSQVPCNSGSNHIARSMPLPTNASGQATLTIPWEDNGFGRGLKSLFSSGVPLTAVHILLVDNGASFTDLADNRAMSYSQAAQALLTAGRFGEADLMDGNHWQPVILASSSDGVTAMMDFGGPYNRLPAGAPMLQLKEGENLTATVTVYAPGAGGVYAPAADRNVTLVFEVDCGGQPVPAVPCNSSNNHIARSMPLPTNASGQAALTIPWEDNGFGRGLKSLFSSGVPLTAVHILLVDNGASFTDLADNRVMSYSQAAQALLARSRFGDADLMDDNHWQPVILASSGEAEPPDESTADYGSGVIGALSELMSNLNAALSALLNGEPAVAGELLQFALSNLGANVVDLINGTDNSVATTVAEAASNPGSLPANLGDLIGLDSDPVSFAQRAIDTARQVEAVVVSGAAIPGWSVPAAVGIAQPYPNGALTGTRDVHAGIMFYPPAGQTAVSGVPVNEIAAYRYAPNDAQADRKGFVEIPVQVDERMPYFLANPNSDFGIYSGTDPELNYVWDLARWNPGNSTDGCNAVPPVGTPDPVPGLDNDDEVVFMAKDAGGQAPPTIVPDNAQLNADGQEIRVVDPLDAATLRYVYLFRKDGGSSFRNQSVYVNYTRDANADQWIDRTFFADNDPQKIGSSNTGYGANLTGTVCLTGAAPTKPSTDRFPRDGLTVTTDAYRWYATGRWMLRDIRIKDPEFTGTPDDAYWATRPDLVDRWKGRAFQQSPDSTISVVGFEDEQVNWEANSALIGERKGPVRAIREVWGADSGTNVTKTETFYRDAITYRYRVRVHPIPPDGLYTDWDYNRSAMVSTDPNVPGGRYFSILRPQGVLIDGINDDIGQVDAIQPVGGQCATLDGPRPAVNGVCPMFFDAPDPTFNLLLGFQNWEQVSGKGDLGSLVYIFEMTGATSLANPLVVPYYRDDACLDDGTGDDPVQRPYPGETSTDSRVTAGYVAAAGGATPYEQLRCDQKQGAHGQHGVHYFFTHDTDNAMSPLATTEIDGTQWQFMVPTATPANIAEPYANVVRAPLKTVVTPRPAPVADGGGDGDSDGVADGDLCPNTPAGQPVDANGCSASQRDTDGDGVKDDVDLCPNTPAGQAVDTSGCSASQRDTDGDTVKDDVDLCPNTPAGQAVNANGCSASQRDTDGDTVKDNVDLCPNTPPGQRPVDTNGCAASQRDTDGDGVKDDVDQCINGAGPASNNGCPLPPDTTPNAFSFNSVSGVSQSTTVSSNVVTITGIDSPTSISVSIGEYRINGGVYTSANGTISNGQTVQVRHTSAGIANTATETSLNIGGVLGNFRSTTAGGADTDPAAFSFTTQTGVAQSTPVISNTIIPAGYDAPTTVKAGAGTEYSIGCNGNFTALQGTISPTQSICVRHTTAGTANTLRKTSLQIGKTVGYFSTRTTP